MSDRSKITMEEMIELFGEEMPPEAVDYVWKAPDDWTIGQVRAGLRELAKQVGYRLYGAGKYCQPGLNEHPTFILRFEEAGLGQMVWSGEGAERQAYRAWNAYAPSYNCYLLKTVERQIETQENKSS